MKLQAITTAINLNKISRVLDYIKKYPSKEGELAKKTCNRLIISTLLVIFLIVMPFIIYTISNITNYETTYPNGATKETKGHISRYDETFWYTDSSQKYEFDLKNYTSDITFEPGEIILIYLDDNDNIISISHQGNQQEKRIVINIILMLVIPVVLLLVHTFIARKTYCKWWHLYVQWYEEEIEPYRFQENFEEIIADKKFYDIRTKTTDLTLEEQRSYKKALFKYILYQFLLVLGIVIAIYIDLNTNINTKIIWGSMIIYILVFYIVIDSSKVEMHRIKTGYYKNK